MGLFRRKRSGGRRGGRPGQLRAATDEDLAHLESFATSRPGVEAYLEPRTTVTETTVVLVATTGEWTRRRVSGPDGARSLGRKLNIPVYDVKATGYPKRMREWTEQRKKRGETGVPGLEGPTP